MRIDVYLALYEDYRKSAVNMAKMIDRIEAGRDEAKTLLTNEKNKNLLMLERANDSLDEVKRLYEKKKRILGRATARLKRAMAKMTDVNEVEYLTYKYFYSLNNSFIADKMMFSERQIYRLSKRAKQHLYEKLLDEMPRARRTGRRRFYLKRQGRRRRRRERKS